MLCSPLGPSSWKPWPSLGLHRARPADQRFNLPHPSFPTQAPKTQNENWCMPAGAGPLRAERARILLQLGPGFSAVLLLPLRIEPCLRQSIAKRGFLRVVEGQTLLLEGGLKLRIQASDILALLERRSIE